MHCSFESSLVLEIVQLNDIVIARVELLLLSSYAQTVHIEVYLSFRCFGSLVVLFSKQLTDHLSSSHLNGSFQ